MSDGIELDDEDLESLYEDDPDALTSEDLFKMVFLNKRTSKKVCVELMDKDGDQIDLADMLQELVGYIKDKLDQDNNQMVDQIMPLMSQALVSGMGRMLGLQATAFFISNPNTRMALIYMMMIAFVLYKMVQVKGLTINTIEEEVTEEEIEEIERKSKASSIMNMSAMLGVDPREALQQMVEKGDLTQDDLQDMLGKVKKDADDGSKNN